MTEKSAMTSAPMQTDIEPTTPTTPRGDKEMRPAKDESQKESKKDEFKDEGLSQLLLYFARFPLDQLAPRSTTGTIRVWKSGNAVTVRQDERVTRAFFKLVTEGFLSAPVLDDRGRYVGIVDLLDLVAFTVELFDEAKLQPTEDQWKQFIEKEKVFWEAKVGDVIKKIGRESDHPVFRGFSVLQAMEIFARTGVHRVAVLDEYQNVVGICTQSMIISLLSQGLDMMGAMKLMAVRELHSNLCQNVFLIKEDQKAIEGFKMMVEKRVHGVAIVDNQGAMIDTLSVRDLRGIGTNASKFRRLYEQVKNFKEAVRQDFAQQTPKTPITVTENDTLERVIKLMDDGNIHRVFEVVPSNGKVKPKHVISQVDVIRFVLKKAGYPFTPQMGQPTPLPAVPESPGQAKDKAPMEKGKEGSIAGMTSSTSGSTIATPMETTSKT
jgi:CBS domain-containing protein